MPAKSFLSLTQSYRFAVGGPRVMKETGCNAKIERKQNGTIVNAKRNGTEPFWKLFFDAYCMCMNTHTHTHIQCTHTNNAP